MLDNPAAVADVADGKEFVDGSGARRTGTKPALDENGIAISKDNGEIQAEVAQGVYTPSVITKIVPAATLEENLLAGNIKAGVTIFGVEGTVQEITAVSGTITLAADTMPLLIPTPYENAKLLIVKVNDVAELATKTDKCFMRVTWQGADIDENFRVDAASFGYNTENPSNPYKGFTFAVNNIGSTVIIGITNWKFPAGVQYNWTVYYWD